MKYLLVILCCLWAIEASAIDWGDNNTNTSNLKDMVDRVKSKFDDINNNPNMKQTLSEAADQVKITMQDNRPSGDFISGCSGECALFREDMKDFITDVEDIVNTLMTFGEPVGQDPVNFDRTRTAISKAPGPVLFPLAIAFKSDGLFSGLTTRLRNLHDPLERIRDRFDDQPSLCEMINSDREAYRKAGTKVAVTGIALKIIGKALLAKGETNMMAKKKVGIHGYAGVIVEDNKKKKIGSMLDGIAGALSMSAASLNRKIFQCEILEAVAIHDMDVKDDIARHDEDVKELLNEIIRLLLTPQGRRSSDFVGAFPLKP